MSQTCLAVNITTFGWAIPLFVCRPAFQLKCPAFCSFFAWENIYDIIISVAITLYKKTKLFNMLCQSSPEVMDISLYVGLHAYVYVYMYMYMYLWLNPSVAHSGGDKNTRWRFSLHLFLSCTGVTVISSYICACMHAFPLFCRFCPAFRSLVFAYAPVHLQAILLLLLFPRFFMPSFLLFLVFS